MSMLPPQKLADAFSRFVFSNIEEFDVNSLVQLVSSQTGLFSVLSADSNLTAVVSCVSTFILFVFVSELNFTLIVPRGSDLITWLTPHILFASLANTCSPLRFMLIPV